MSLQLLISHYNELYLINNLTYVVITTYILLQPPDLILFLLHRP